MAILGGQTRVGKRTRTTGGGTANSDIRLKRAWAPVPRPNAPRSRVPNCRLQVGPDSAWLRFLPYSSPAADRDPVLSRLAYIAISRDRLAILTYTGPRMAFQKTQTLNEWVVMLDAIYSGSQNYAKKPYEIHAQLTDVCGVVAKHRFKRRHSIGVATVVPTIFS